MTKLNLTADEVLTTTRSVRKRLDFDREVSTDVIMECLEIALQAPTGSNRQGWQWMFITDESDRATLKEIYAENFALYRQMPRPEYDADDLERQPPHELSIPLNTSPTILKRRLCFSFLASRAKQMLITRPRSGALCFLRCGASCSLFATRVGLCLDDITHD